MASLFARQDRWVNILGIISLIAITIGLYLAFIYAPTDATQGHAQRIFYIHVPMAWLAYMSYGFILVGSIGYLWKKDLKWDRLARGAAELGFLFTTLVLISGSLWGRPIWGTWWEWEARLTTTLVLWFIYLGYFVVRSYAGEVHRGARWAAVLGLIGAIDVPIIHLSVQWWRTLHPTPVVLKSSGPSLPDSMLYSMLWMFAAFTLLFFYLLILKTRIEKSRDQIMDQQLQQMLAAGRSASMSETPAPATGQVSGGSENQ